MALISGTVPEEHMFTVYLGDVPADVELAAVHLNGQEYAIPFTNTSSHSITQTVHPNNTHGYTLKVPFDDPVVMKQVKVFHFVQFLLQMSWWFIGGSFFCLLS